MKFSWRAQQEQIGRRLVPILVAGGHRVVGSTRIQIRSKQFAPKARSPLSQTDWIKRLSSGLWHLRARM